MAASRVGVKIPAIESCLAAIPFGIIIKSRTEEDAMKKLAGLVVTLALCLSLNVFAADSATGTDKQPPPPPGGKMRPIPQEAITACTGKAVGVTCAAGPAGAGTCQYTPDKKYFACKPNGRPPGPPPAGNSSK